MNMDISINIKESEILLGLLQTLPPDWMDKKRRGFMSQKGPTSVQSVMLGLNQNLGICICLTNSLKINIGEIKLSKNIEYLPDQ
jgi:hypothetical protein